MTPKVAIGADKVRRASSPIQAVWRLIGHRTARPIVAASVIAVALPPYLGATVALAWMAFMVSTCVVEWAIWRLAPRLTLPILGLDLLRAAASAGIGFALVQLEQPFTVVLAMAIWGSLAFRALVVDYRRPLQLWINLGPQLAAGVGRQVWASVQHVRDGAPLLVVPEMAAVVLVLATIVSIYVALMQRRRTYERVLAESGDKTRLVEEAHRAAVVAEQLAGSGHFRVDLRTSESRFSDGLYNLHGVDATDTATVATLLKLYQEEDQERIKEMVSQVVLTRGPVRSENRLRLRDGRERILLTQANPEFDAAGEVVAVFGISMDVTEARRRETALADSEARLRLLADNVTDIVLWVDGDHRILYASPSVSTLGCLPESMLDRRLSEFIHPDDHDEAGRLMSRILRDDVQEGGLRGELRFLSLRALGECIWLEGFASAVRDPEGRPRSAVINFRNVTRRRELEQDLREAKVRAEEATRAKSEFLANMSHEIRTPLTGVIGFSEILSRTPGLPDPAEGYVRKVMASGEALLAVVNDILDFSKLEAGQVTLEPAPLKVADFLAEVASLFSLQAAEKKLGLQIEVSDTTPEYVLADRGRLQQVLTNLLSNAIKFTEAGHVRVSARYAPDRRALEVSVADTGVGIPKEQVEKLFQRFIQADGSITRKFGGTGLGLSICRQLTSLMGGSISLSSRPGLGSTFTFDVAAPPAAAPSPPPPPSEFSRTDSQTEALRVLIVDDLDTNRELVRALLEATGIEIEEAASGQQAVTLAVRQAYDLILMDLQMPGMDGFATAKAIRQLSRENRRTPIIALSANVLAEHVADVERAGMNDHVAKPIVPAHLFAAINRWAGVASGDKLT